MDEKKANGRKKVDPPGGAENLTLLVGAQSAAPNDTPGGEQPSGSVPTGESVPSGTLPQETFTGFVVTEEIARKVLELPFNFVATRRGDFWKLSSPEVDLISPPLARLLSQYSFQLTEKFPDASLILIGLAFSVGGRLTMDVAARRKAEKEAAEAVKKAEESKEDGRETSAA